MLRRLMTISAAAALLAGCYYDMDEIPYTGDNVTGVDVVTIAGTGSPGSKDGAATKEATFKVPSKEPLRASTMAWRSANEVSTAIKAGRRV